MNRFFKFVPNEKKMLAAILVVSLLISFINIFTSTLFGYIVDDVTQSVDSCTESDHEHQHTEEEDQNEEENLESTFVNFIVRLDSKLALIFENIDTVCITVIFLLLIKAVVQTLRGFLLSIMARRIEIPITLNYYNHLVDMPAGFFGTRKTGVEKQHLLN